MFFFPNQEAVLCRRCINLMDHADNLKVKISLMSEELEEISTKIQKEVSDALKCPQNKRKSSEDPDNNCNLPKKKKVKFVVNFFL